MTIAEAREKCNGFLAKIPKDALIVAVLALSATMSFALGYLAGREGQGSEISVAPPPLAAAAAAPTADATSGQYVASKNGSKYYLPSCSGADRITDANKVWFATKDAAIAAGYAPASNCKGL